MIWNANGTCKCEFKCKWYIYMYIWACIYLYILSLLTYLFIHSSIYLSMHLFIGLHVHHIFLGQWFALNARQCVPHCIPQSDMFHGMLLQFTALRTQQIVYAIFGKTPPVPWSPWSFDPVWMPLMQQLGQGPQLICAWPAHGLWSGGVKRPGMVKGRF